MPVENTRPKLAILGPPGSFSEVAAIRYLTRERIAADLLPQSNILKTFAAIGHSCQMGIIPIENMIEGYVPMSLDLLAESSLKIIGEIVIPVNFSFVANCRQLSDIKRIYVQFVTEGQCRSFLATLPSSCKIITTDSNSASWEAVRQHQPDEAAIIPDHLFQADSFPLGQALVSEGIGNRTRFIVLAPSQAPQTQSGLYRTSIVIRELDDKPGALYAIIGAFARRELNLSCIMSRPNKLELGRYFFFMDIDAPWPADHGLVAALDEIATANEVKILGSYPQASALAGA